METLRFFEKPKPAPFPENNPIKYDFNFESMMQFIQYNKIIREKLASFNTDDHQKKITNLLEAYKKGKLSEEMISDPNSDLYILYLLKEKKIEFPEFFNLYMILSAYMQFSDNCPIKQTDAAIKVPDSTIEVSSHAAEPWNMDILISHVQTCLRPLLRHKQDMAERLGQLKKKLDELPETDKNMLVITWKNSDNVKEITKLMQDSVQLTPFFLHAFSLSPSGTNEITIPSYKIISLIIDIISPKGAVKYAPIFGKVGEDTLFWLHQNNLHPINLYSKYVRDNMTKLHDTENVGPLTDILHDFYHIYSGNVLEPGENAFLYQYLIPHLLQTLDKSIKDFTKLLGTNMIIDMNLANYLSTHGKHQPFIPAFVHALGIQKKDEKISLVHNLEQDLKGDDLSKILKFMQTLFNDRERISETYKIDIIKVFKSPSFNELSRIPGECLIELFDKKIPDEGLVNGLKEILQKKGIAWDFDDRIANNQLNI